MGNTLWKGFISLGLMNIPVQLYKAADEPTKVSFREINSATNNPVGRKRVDSVTGDDVDYDAIVKGYEVSPGKYVTFTKEEIEALQPQRTTTISIEGFVDLDQIPLSKFDEPYFISTDEAGAKPYKIFAEAMKAKGKVAIGKIVMRNTERLVAITPTEDGLTLSTLRWAEQMRDTKAVATDVEVKEEELALGTALIDAMAGDVDLDAYANDFNESVATLIEERANNPEAAPIQVDARYEPERPDDIMEILRRSVEEQQAKEMKAGGDN